MSGEGTSARIIQHTPTCTSHVYLLDYVPLPVTDIKSLPPFELDPQPIQQDEEAAAAAAAAATAAQQSQCAPTDTAWFTLKATPKLSTMARCVMAVAVHCILYSCG